MALGVAFVVGLAADAAADTIYLKNGRTFRTISARVEGDRLIFIQYNGEVSIPMALVDRIEKDENVGPAGTPTPPPGTEAAPDEPVEGEPEPGDVPPQQTRQYWQDRVRTIVSDREEVEMQIEDLRRTERAFLFSHRSTAQVRQEMEDAEARLVELDEEMRDVEAEARGLGVPAGWLRVDPSGGGETGGQRDRAAPAQLARAES